MAEYSKQWCEIWDPEMPHDFDVLEIAKDMYSDRYYPIICEGLGFHEIHKDRHGNIWLGYEGIDPNTTYWKRLSAVLLEEKRKADAGSNLQ